MRKTAGIETLFEATEFIRSEIGNVSILQVQILIYVMINDGCAQAELASRFQTTAATISRNLNNLSTNTLSREKVGGVEVVTAGLGYLRFEVDPEETRRHLIYLTESGQALREKLAWTLKGKKELPAGKERLRIGQTLLLPEGD